MYNYIRKLEEENSRMKDLFARLGMAMLEDILNTQECHCDCKDCDCDCDEEDSLVLICPNCGNVMPFIEDCIVDDGLCICDNCEEIFAVEDALFDIDEDCDGDCENCELHSHECDDEDDTNEIEKSLINVLNTIKERAAAVEIKDNTEKVIENSIDAVNNLFNKVKNSETVKDLKKKGINIIINVAENLEKSLDEDKQDEEKDMDN